MPVLTRWVKFCVVNWKQVHLKCFACTHVVHMTGECKTLLVKEQKQSRLGSSWLSIQLFICTSSVSSLLHYSSSGFTTHVQIYWPCYHSVPLLRAQTIGVIRLMGSPQTRQSLIAPSHLISCHQAVFDCSFTSTYLVTDPHGFMMTAGKAQEIQTVQYKQLIAHANLPWLLIHSC